MADENIQPMGWQDQLQAAFAAKQAERSQRMATAAAEAEKAKQATHTTGEPAAAVTNEPAQEQIESSQPQEQPREVAPAEAQEAFLQDEPTDTAEVTALKKNLRAGFHKKMQELEDKINGLGGGLDSQKKAQLLDSLMASEDPAAAITSVRQALGIAPQQANAPQGPFASRVMKERFLKTGLHEAVVDPLEDSLDAYMEQKYGFALPLLAWVEQQVVKDASSECGAIATEFGDDANKLKQQAYELAAASGGKLPIRNALIALNPELATRKVAAQKRAEVETRQEAGLTRANGLTNDQKGPQTYAAHRAALVKALLLADKGNGKPQYVQNKVR